MVNLSFPKREVGILAAMLGVSFLIRALLFPLQGYANDMGTYASWFNTAAENGIRPFYRVVGWVDYPPFSVYIFWVFGSLGQAVAGYGVSITNIIKLVPNLFDLATAAVIYFYVRKQASFKIALTATALYTFNAAVIYNAAVWGQFDAIYTFFLVVSLVLALKSKPYYSAAAFAVALLTKPQGIALAPLLILLIYMKAGVNHANKTSLQNSPQKKLLRLKNAIVEAWPKLKILLISIVVFVATVFLVILPFEWSNPVTFLSDIYFGALGGYKETSVNAFNLWAFAGLRAPDGNLFWVGWALFGAVAAFTLFVMHKRFKVSGDWLVLFCAFMLFFSFFMLPTRIHERYMFPVISLLAIMAPLIPKMRTLYVALTATLLINQAYVLATLNSANPFLSSGDPIVLGVSALNLVMFFYCLILMWDELRGRHWLKGKPADLNQSQQRGEPT